MSKKGSGNTKTKGNAQKAGTYRNWSLGAVVVGLLGTFLILITLLSRPQFVILHHTIVLTQGIIFPAVLMGAVVWALVEFFTPPSHGIADLLVRIIPAFIIGAFVGGLAGYLFHFGDYVIDPAFNGNPSALLFLVSVLVASLAVTWNAVWSHTHGFLGQKGNGNKVDTTHSEPGTSKGRRGILALLVIFLVVFLVAPAGSAIGSALVSGHDNSSVLQQESTVTYISGSSGAVPFATTNGTTTFDFPSTSIHNATTNTTTVTYGHTVYIRTNLTLAELNNYAVSKLVLATNVKYYDVTLGTGTNATVFTPIAFLAVRNSTTASLSLAPYELTGNQTSPVELEINGNITSMSLSIAAYGNNGFLTTFGPYAVIQVSYIVGAVILFAASFLEISVYDISLDALGAKAGKRAPAKKGGK